MEPISPTDALFLIGESREHPMHVGALQLFRAPDDAGPAYVRESYEAMLGCTDVQPTVSRLHGSLLDRHKPLWEAHLIEGLHDGRYAVYTKFHHSLMDGMSALRLMLRAFTPDPGDDEARVPWSLGPRTRTNQCEQASGLRQFAGTIGAAAALGPSTVRLARAALLQQQLTLPFRAPRTMFNVRIGGARRVAAQSWALDRIKAVKSAAAVTVNDVILAMSSGALRAYLIEQNALPDRPLIAMVPVNLRNENDDRGGNMVGTFLCNLATDQDDPAKRLDIISSSMRDTPVPTFTRPRTGGPRSRRNRGSEPRAAH